MNHSHKLHAIKAVFLAAALTTANFTLAQEPPAKETLCRACHGASGAAPIADSYPKLNGQNKAYLESALKAYRSGTRSGGLASAMVMQAKNLTDAEISALANYYASQK